jgi:hypothetical protein
MVKPQICQNEAEIRTVIANHLTELVAEKQEVRIRWGENRFPIECVIRGYEPPEPKGEYADALFVHFGGDEVYITTPTEISYFEVLSTKRMTPQLGYAQMREMERSFGCKG